MIVETDLIDVIVRTKNSEEFLRECLQSVIDEIPVRRKKVESYLADHYPKIEGYTIRRTGIILRIEQVFVPKNVQIEEGRVARRYHMISKKQAFTRLVLLPLYDGYKSFKKNFWFCLAYFKII